MSKIVLFQETHSEHTAEYSWRKQLEGEIIFNLGIELLKGWPF